MSTIQLYGIMALFGVFLETSKHKSSRNLGTLLTRLVVQKFLGARTVVRSWLLGLHTLLHLMTGDKGDHSGQLIGINMRCSMKAATISWEDTLETARHVLLFKGLSSSIQMDPP